MTTIINEIKLQDDWVQHQDSYIKYYIIEPYTEDHIIDPSLFNPAFEIWSISLKWFISIYHYQLEKPILNFYNTDSIRQRFSSADEAMLYVDTFINKYNKLKVFL